MRNAIGFSVLFHSAVLVIGYFGLPYIQTSALLTDTPIMVEIVNVAEMTNAPPPKPKPDKKTEKEVKKEEPPKKPPPPCILLLLSSNVYGHWAIFNSRFRYLRRGGQPLR